jgi:hypothetical protein
MVFTVEVAIKMIETSMIEDERRGLQESHKRFAIINSINFWSNVLRIGAIAGHSKKLMQPDDVGYLKLLEEPDLVVCETRSRCDFFRCFNLPAITYFDAISSYVWADPMFYNRRLFFEGTLHHALKSHLVSHFGLKYISMKALKKEGFVL